MSFHTTLSPTASTAAHSFLLALLIAAGLAAQPSHNHSPQPASAPATTTTTTTALLPTARFRETHKEELQHLLNVQTWNAQLRHQSDAEQKATTENILNFFRNRLIPHAQWEETHLYPLINKLTSTTPQNRYTDTMRHEHKIVARWIHELETEAASPAPDYNKFAQKTDQLTGLVRGHFELEDEVLLPHVDNTMTQPEFEKAIGHSH